MQVKIFIFQLSRVKIIHGYLYLQNQSMDINFKTVSVNSSLIDDFYFFFLPL